MLAGIAFLPAMPTDVAPFVLALGPLVVALALALVEGNGAITRLIRTLTVIPQNRLWFLVIVLPVVWAVTVLIVAIVAGAPAEGLFDGVGLDSLVVLLVVLIPPSRRSSPGAALAFPACCRSCHRSGPRWSWPCRGRSCICRWCSSRARSTRGWR